MRGAEQRSNGRADFFRDELDGWCEKGILGLVLAILVFGPLAMGAVNRWQFLIIQALTMGVMALWAVRFWVGSRPQLLWPPICWAVVAFVLYAIVRYCQAEIEFVARQELIRILIYAFLFFAILNNLHGQETGRIIVVTMIFLGMVISFYAAYQFVTRSGGAWTVSGRYPGRAGGTFVYPNSLAGFLEMLVPLGLSYVLIGRLSHLTKIFLCYATLVMLAGIGVTVSRGGWAATGISLGVFGVVLLFQRHYRIQALVMLAVVAAVGVYAVPRARTMQQRIQDTFASGKANDLRVPIWDGTIHMWHDHFWQGVGPGHFDHEFPLYRPLQVQYRPVWAHNDYLNTLADWGLAGAVLVAGALGCLLWGVIRAWKYVQGAADDFARKPSNRFALLLGASMGLVAILLHSAVDFNMQIPANAILAVSLMALLSGQWRFATERHWFSAGMATKCVGTVALLAGLGYLCAQEWRGGREAFWFHRAGRAQYASTARINALERAFAAEPMNAETSYAIGESYRAKSWEGNDDYASLAKKAMEWYQRGMKLDPLNSYNWLRYGMCQDWIGDGEQSEAAYQHANELDPNGYFTTATIGWHYVQAGDYAGARTWFQRSIDLEWDKAINPLPFEYMPIIERRLTEAAAVKKQGS